MLLKIKRLLLIELLVFSSLAVAQGAASFRGQPIGAELVKSDGSIYLPAEEGDRVDDAYEKRLKAMGDALDGRDLNKPDEATKGLIKDFGSTFDSAQSYRRCKKSPEECPGS